MTHNGCLTEREIEAVLATRTEVATIAQAGPALARKCGTASHPPTSDAQEPAEYRRKSWFANGSADAGIRAAQVVPHGGGNSWLPTNSVEHHQ